MSDEHYVIRNQLGQYWARSGEWTDGREPQRVLKNKHRDEAINQLVELSAKDIDLRGEVLGCPIGAKNEPVLEPSEHRTATLAEQAAVRAAEAAVVSEDAAATMNDALDTQEAPLTAEPPSGAAV